MACVERIIMLHLFARTPIEMQPIWAIVFPLVREFDYCVFKHLMLKVTDGKNRHAKLGTLTEHNCNYSAFLVIVIDFLATDTAQYSILLVEFSINIYNCVSTVRMKRRINSNDSEREVAELLLHEEIQDSVMIELV